jgi:hypothetical protein
MSPRRSEGSGVVGLRFYFGAGVIGADVIDAGVIEPMRMIWFDIVPVTRTFSAANFAAFTCGSSS